MANERKSDSLQSALLGKLKARVSGDPLLIFKESWQTKRAETGFRYAVHQASTPRFSDDRLMSWRHRVDDGGRYGEIDINGAEKAFSAGWSTPVAQPANGTPEAFLARKRNAVAAGSKMGVCVSDIAMQAYLSYLGDDPREATQFYLNPALMRWLMGFPEAWCLSIISEHRGAHASKTDDHDTI